MRLRVPPPLRPQRLPRRLAAGQLATEELRLRRLGGGKRGAKGILVLLQQPEPPPVEMALLGLQTGFDVGQAALAVQLGGACRLGLLEQALPRQRVRLELDGERLELRRHARCRGELLTGDGQALVALQTHLLILHGPQLPRQQLRLGLHLHHRLHLPPPHPLARRNLRLHISQRLPLHRPVRQQGLRCHHHAPSPRSRGALPGNLLLRHADGRLRRRHPALPRAALVVDGAQLGGVGGRGGLQALRRAPVHLLRCRQGLLLGLHLLELLVEAGLHGGDARGALGCLAGGLSLLRALALHLLQQRRNLALEILLLFPPMRPLRHRRPRLLSDAALRLVSLGTQLRLLRAQRLGLVPQPLPLGRDCGRLLGQLGGARFSLAGGHGLPGREAPVARLHRLLPHCRHPLEQLRLVLLSPLVRRLFLRHPRRQRRLPPLPRPNLRSQRRRPLIILRGRSLLLRRPCRCPGALQGRQLGRLCRLSPQELVLASTEGRVLRL
mmetsp:Transcript_24862/g.78178  ORF Transcript_24862/g.78178 Transcript_24862/m.78178 type:complete len:496 (+) Transcript_24862:2503-3990(+)